MRDGGEPPLPTVDMLWVEGRLGAIERACMRSVLRQRHRLVLWHYFPLECVPEGVELRDGNEVVPRERLFRHVPTGSWALFSNLFRYTLLKRDLGIWLDCDTYLVRPVPKGDGYIFGTDIGGTIQSGVLGLPANLPLLDQLIAYFDARKVPPWLPWRWQLRFYGQRILRGRFQIDTMPWGNLGPYGLTVLLRKYGLAKKALPPVAFYPWPWQEAWIIREPQERATARIASETISFHLYNEMIRRWKNDPAPPGSFLARLQQEGA